MTQQIKISLLGAAALMILTTLAIAGPPRGLTAKELGIINKAIKSKEIVRVKGMESPNVLEPTPDSRRYLVGDVGSDGAEDIVVQFILEEGNAWRSYLLVMERKTLRIRGPLHIGGYGYRQATIDKIKEGRIHAKTRYYGPEDSLAEPTVPGESWFVIGNGGIEEQYAIVKVKP